MAQEIIAFLAMTVLDITFGLYTLAVANNQKVIASLMASAIIVCNVAVIKVNLDDPWLIVPTAFGAFVGTYLAFLIEQHGYGRLKRGRVEQQSDKQ